MKYEQHNPVPVPELGAFQSVRTTENGMGGNLNRLQPPRPLDDREVIDFNLNMNAMLEVPPPAELVQLLDEMMTPQEGAAAG